MTDLSSLSGLSVASGGSENSRINFALGVLSYAGWPATEGNIKALVTWMQKENTTAGYNPLATSRPMPGAGFYNYLTDDKKSGVRNYTSFEQGVQATVETINNGNYPNIVEGFKGGLSGPEGLNLGDLAMWGTGDRANAGQYIVTDKGYFPDHPDYRVGTDQGNFDGSSLTYSRIPEGYTAYEVGGKTYLAYDMVPGRSIKIVVEHTGSQRVDATRIDANAWGVISDGWIEGGTTSEGMFVDTRFNSGTRSWNDIVEGLLYAAGLYGTDALESDDVMAVIAEFIARPDMQTPELDARLQQTDWWDQTTEAQRGWNDLSTVDQIKSIKDNAQVLAGIWTAYTGEQIDLMSFDTDDDGVVSVDEIDAGNTELGEWARKLSAGEVSQQTVVLEWVRPAALEINNSPANRIIIEEEQAQNERGFTIGENKKEVADLWERYGIDISDADASNYADQMYMQEKSLADYEETAKTLSDVRWQGKPEGVDFDTWSKPYATTYANLLEVGEPTFRDDDFAGFLDDGVGGEGGVNMYDFKKSLRKDARWANTQNAKTAYSQTLGSLGRMMGFG